ncbi:linear amide C-N hydrolase [Eubacterium aggregans]|uniref:linear amide C-N hydrolase n=1 Tax=Eubacterium aggregans TaxID=81409 RepID=UPI003F2D470E
MNRRKKQKVSYLLGILVMIVLALVFIFIDYGRTMLSYKRGAEGLYQLNYQLEYKLDTLMNEEGGTPDIGALLQHVYKTLFFGIPFENAQTPTYNCSAFSAITPEGEHLMGRNYDLDDTTGIFVKISSTQNYQSVSMVDAQFLCILEGEEGTLINRIALLAAPFIPVDGINEKGVGIAVLYDDSESTNQKTGKTPIISTVAIREVLDTAGTVEEAIAVFEKYDMHTPYEGNYHFFITDKTGISKVVEYYNNEMRVLDTTMTTNFMFAKGIGSGHVSSNECYRIIKQELDGKNGVLTEKEAMTLLKAAQGLDIPKERTQWSVVYNLDTQIVTVCKSQDYSHPHYFKLN